MVRGRTHKQREQGLGPKGGILGRAGTGNVPSGSSQPPALCRELGARRTHLDKGTLLEIFGGLTVHLSFRKKHRRALSLEFPAIPGSQIKTPALKH